MAAYIDHIVEQIQHNVNFLLEQGHISQQDSEVILARLPSAEAAPTMPQSVAARVPPAPIRSASTTASASGRRGVPPPPARFVQARAIWAYNENGQDPDDLSFRTGDIVEIVAETNADWWTGKCNGKQGLFPSNHVEKLSIPATPTSASAAPVRTVPAPPPQYDQHVQPPKEKSAYRPFGAALHGTDTPPAPGAGQVNSVGLQQADQTKQKSKYGKLGNTMANSAAGGVGFGAGAAIGGGLVRAIF